MATAQKCLPTPERLAKDAVKELYKTLMTPRISELIETALARNLFPEEVLRRCTMNGLAQLCREVLKEKDPETGLALAKPLGRGNDARWQRIPLMDLREAHSLLENERKGIEDDVREYRKYEKYFQNKFGESAIPTFDFGDGTDSDIP